MKLNLHKTTIHLVAFAITLLPASVAEASKAPPIKITMPADTQQAVSGQVYEGDFEVHVARPGAVSDFKLEGPGWTVLALESPSDGFQAATGLLRVPFRAVPSVADSPLTLSLSYEGRRVTRTVRIGPAKFAMSGKAYPALAVGAAEAAPARSPAPPTENGARGCGGYMIRVTGQIVYQREDGLLVGVDHILVQVKDDDDLVEDLDGTIWEGETNIDGTFDTDWICWDDDLDESGPDIYLRWECDTGVVDVEDGEYGPAPQPDWSWSTEDTAFHFEDFGEETGGGFLDFGMQTSADSALMPAMHIHNSIVRAHRFIQTRSGIGLSDVEVLWPDGDNADYSCDFEEMSISHAREWNEATHSHEYGHHFECEVAIDNTPDYCNGICDTAEDDCGHCEWCEENETDAWHEGFPNWLADVITRSYETDYVDLGGCPYRPLNFRDGETPDTCSCRMGLSCPAGTFGPALSTEGFVHVMLRDIEDAEQDDHNGDGIVDCANVGPGVIIQAVDAIEPDTLLQFLDGFRALHPAQTHRLWPTAFNVDPALLAGFPADSGSPGPVAAAASPTHPLGTGGPLPCIIVEWEPPTDDVTGANAYSYIWSSNPASPDEPDFTEDVTGTCKVSVPSPPIMPGGLTYVRIRARDHAGHWGASSDWLGPFVVTGDECALHDNGVPDVCDSYCDLVAAPIACETPILFDYCGSFASCGTVPDCNTNGMPDDCDIAEGTSYDCAGDGIPDECQSMRYWVAEDGSWHVDANWDSKPPLPAEACAPPPPPADPGVPEPLDDVCIDAATDATVTYMNGASAIQGLFCRDNLTISQSGTPVPLLTLQDESFVLGKLTLSGGSAELIVNDALELAGGFDWTARARLRGTGVTTVTGGMHILNERNELDGHTLIIGGASPALCDGALDFFNAATLRILPGAVYNHRSGLYVASGANTNTIDNQGTFIKSVDTGQRDIGVFMNNSGVVLVEAGVLRLVDGSSSTGSFVALPGTTLAFVGGNHELLPSSSITGETVHFLTGSTGDKNIYGAYDVSGTTRITGTTFFRPGANIISYGSDLVVAGGQNHFEAVVGAPIQFNSMSIASICYFDSGDPVITNSMAISSTYRGSCPLTITGPLTFDGGTSFFGPGGDITAQGPVTVTVSASNRYIENRVFNNGGYATFLRQVTLRNNGQFNNLDTGVMDFQFDGTVIAKEGGSLSNAGLIVKSIGSGTSTVQVDTTNTGTVEVQAGTLAFGANAVYTQAAGQTVLNGGNFSMTGTTPGPVRILGGVLTGFGTVTGNVNNVGGAVEPGLSAGQLSITGNYTQPSAGSLEIELGGPTPGTEHDVLAVTGTATLAGSLRVGLINGFIPIVGEQFTILTAGSVGGGFTTVESLTPGLTVAVIYNPTSVVLEVTDAPLAGDCDADGDVDLDDYSGFPACAGGPDAPYGAPDCDCLDPDADLDIDLADFAALQKDFTG